MDLTLVRFKCLPFIVGCMRETKVVHNSRLVLSIYSATVLVFVSYVDNENHPKSLDRKSTKVINAVSQVPKT